MPAETEQTRTLSRFFPKWITIELSPLILCESLPSNSFRSLGYARGNESIIYFTDLCKPIETYIYAKKNTHLQVIPQQRTQTQQTCGYRHTTKNQWTYFHNAARGSTLALAIIFIIQVPLQKFPILLRYTIPCLNELLQLLIKREINFGAFNWQTIGVDLSRRVFEECGINLKAGSHCNADLRQCNVADVLGQCEHCSSVIAVAVLMFGVLSEKFGSVKLFR